VEALRRNYGLAQVDQRMRDLRVLRVDLIAIADGDDVLPRRLDSYASGLVHGEFARALDLVCAGSCDLVVRCDLRDNGSRRKRNAFRSLILLDPALAN